jgi:hypothetical protein
VKTLVTILLLVALSYAEGDSVIVRITQKAASHITVDTSWLDTIPHRFFLAGGQYSSAKWTLSAGDYVVRVVGRVK